MGLDTRGGGICNTYNFFHMSKLSDKTLEIAISQIGETEKPLGSNWGHPVQDYLASVGIHFPASWCMAFMFWCVDQAVKILVKTNEATWISFMQSYNPLNHTGSVLRQWQTINPKFKTPEGSAPQPGDIFIMDLGGGLGHTGIVESINADGTLNTIEGNTNDTGSREGVEVARKIRHNAKPIIGYIRF